MKMTIDLPEHLVREMKLRAIHEGRKLKDIAAEVLEKDSLNLLIRKRPRACAHLFRPRKCPSTASL